MKTDYEEVNELINNCSSLSLLKDAFTQIIDNHVKDPNAWEYIKDELLELFKNK